MSRLKVRRNENDNHAPEPSGPVHNFAVWRPLSNREMEIVALARQAKSNKEIAAELQLSCGTVKEHLSRIFRKLGVRGRVDLLRYVG